MEGTQPHPPPTLDSFGKVNLRKEHIMTSKVQILAYSLLAVIGVAAQFAYQTTGEVDAKSLSHASAEANYLPRKGWTVGFHAFRMNGYKDLPVKVYGVTSAGR